MFRMKQTVQSIPLLMRVACASLIDAMAPSRVQLLSHGETGQKDAMGRSPKHWLAIFAVWIALISAFPAAWNPSSMVSAQENAAAPADAPPEKPPSLLIWLAKTSGFIGLIILIISFTFVARVVSLFLDLRRDVVAPAAFLQQCEDLLAKRDYQGTYQLAVQNDNPVAKLLAVGLVSLSSGLDEAREAMDREGEAITVHMEKRISLLAVIGTLGPMIGLLGTLKGMIASFSVIATSGTQLKASEVAGGISEALVLTFEGVALSVPAIYFFSLFKDRVATLSVEVQNIADEFIRKVAASGGRKAAAT